MLALDRAQRLGLPVRYLFNIYDGCSGRVRFHGVRRELIAAQADSLGLELIQMPAGPTGFEAAFQAILDELAGCDVRGTLFGNIHLADVRAWYEERTTGAGFEHIEPLWGEPPADLIREFCARGHRALIVSVDIEAADARWLGQEIGDELIAEILANDSVDPCGERGEFHSFAFAGPLFRRPIAAEPGETKELEGHRLLDLRLRTPAGA